MADIFISYKREDKHLAEDTISRLQDAGYSVWYDERINPQSSWDETIEREIAAAKAVIILWTERSVASEWVRSEADYAKEHGKMIPVKLEACSLPLAYRRTQTADLSSWDGNPADLTWQKVLEWVRGLVSGTGTQPGGIGPSISGGTGATHSDRRYGGGPKLWTGLILALLIGGSGVLWATGVIGPEVFAQTPSPETAVMEMASGDTLAEDAPPRELPRAQPAAAEMARAERSAEDAPPREILRPQTAAREPEITDASAEAISAAATACFGLWLTADREDPNGHNWDVGPGMLAVTRPDIRVTSASHADLRLSCEDMFQCSGGPFSNTDGHDIVTLLVMDDDLDADDMVGQGNCAIPSNQCRIGSALVDVRETPCG